jgi:hypothetical protein
MKRTSAGAGAVPRGSAPLRWTARPPVRVSLALSLLRCLWPVGWECCVEGLVARSRLVRVQSENLARLEASAALLPELERQVRELHRQRFPRAVREGVSLEQLQSDLRLAHEVDGLDLESV